tara:strand:+ start:399 stop:590 length:192 start_codon:yes stop_codon:yes gene_type:complete
VPQSIVHLLEGGGVTPVLLVVPVDLQSLGVGVLYPLRLYLGTPPLDVAISVLGDDGYLDYFMH